MVSLKQCSMLLQLTIMRDDDRAEKNSFRTRSCRASNLPRVSCWLVPFPVLPRALLQAAKQALCSLLFYIWLHIILGGCVRSEPDEVLVYP